MEVASLQRIKEVPRESPGFTWLICSYLFFLLPLSTYAAFQEEVQLNLLPLAVTLGVLVILAAMGLLLLRRRLPRGMCDALDAALMLAGLFLTYNFYAGDYQGKIIGADPDVLDNDYSLGEIALFVGVVAVTVMFFRRFRPHFPAAASVLILAGLVNLIPLFSDSAESRVAVYNDPLEHADFLRFSGKGDVVHIVLDGMQGTYFSKMLERDASFHNRFGGFTFFPDTTTSSEVTYLSIPAVMSGSAWDGRGSIQAYLRASGSVPLENGSDPEAPSLPRRLKDNGYRLEILAGPGGLMKQMGYYDTYFHTDFLDQRERYDVAMGRLLDLTLIKVMPWSVKRRVYRQGQWLFSNSYGYEVPRANRAYNFLNQYAGKVTAEGGDSRYKFIHLISPHAPWTTGESCIVLAADAPGRSILDQSRCIMLAVAELVASMRRIGVFDDSVIIVHGDHGMCNPANLPREGADNPDIPKCVGNANPLLMVKLPGQSGRLRISDHLVELTDIAPTILEALSLEHPYEGENVFDADGTRTRTRYYYRFEPNRIKASKQDKVDEVLRYEVRGSIFDAESWCQPEVGECR
jgi:hypothetical protein